MNYIGTYDYNEWGYPIIISGLDNDVVTVNELIYKDYVYDWESELYYLQTRYYSPVLMRFISMDNLEKIAESNYSYKTDFSNSKNIIINKEVNNNIISNSKNETLLEC